MTKPTTALVPVKAIAPSLKDGSDAVTAKKLQQLYKDAQNGLRRVVAFGLFCFEIKEKLPHGKFQNWIMAACPQVSITSAKAYMNLTSNVLETCGTNVGNYLQMASTLAICQGGKLLLLPEKKVPEAAKELRAKVFSIIDGKSQRQLMFEFKQVEDDGAGGLKSKVGRRKGEGGVSAAQRLSAKERAEQEKNDQAELDAESLCDALDEIGDDDHLGRVSDALLEKVTKRLETVYRYAAQLRKTRSK